MWDLISFHSVVRANLRHEPIDTFAPTGFHTRDVFVSGGRFLENADMQAQSRESLDLFE
jgi:hypothetical protein